MKKKQAHKYYEKKKNRKKQLYIIDLGIRLRYNQRRIRFTKRITYWDTITKFISLLR